MKSFFYILSAILLLSFFSCQREVNDFSQDPNANDPGISFPLNATVTGLVVDENNQPLAGAVIRTRTGAVTNTDARGYFRFPNISFDKYASLITAGAPGYFKGYRVFAATGKGTGFVKFQLMRRAPAGTVAAATGGQISVSGHTITFPANAFVKKSDNLPYTGTVTVFAQDIDPVSPGISALIPGGLIATDSMNRRVMLQSFGMINTELQGSGGEPLQLATGKTALIKYSIPPSLAAQAPSTIPMWFIDESTGLWKEEGKAVKTGGYYSGEVKHFTPWNFDLGILNLVYLEMRIKDNAGNPVPHTLVTITADNVAGSGWSTTGFSYSDSAGYTSTLIPANSPLTIRVLDECYTPVHTFTRPPLTQNTNLGDITVDLGLNKLVVGGTIKNCTGQPVTTGYAIVYLEGKSYNIPVNSLGRFSVSLTNCSANTVTITPVDAGAAQTGDPVVYPVTAPGLTNLNLTACGNVLLNYNVTTLAGNGIQGFAEGTGAAAKFYNPNGIAVDPAGNVFVADGDNNRIRKITPAGVVTTFAGSGTAGYADGPEATAKFNGAFALALDGSGNLYVAEMFNHCIRKITPAGVVSTFCGDPGNPGYQNGTGTSAKFSSPQGLVFNQNGDLIVADALNNCIRKVTAGAVVTTIAGTTVFGFSDGPGTSAQFASPFGLETDAAGNIYVADWGNNRIRKITPAAVVSTYAGSGAMGFLDGPAGSAQFSRPYDVTADASGNIYVADLDNNRIRKISTTGSVTTVAGSTFGFIDGPGTSALFKHPSGITMDASRNIYVSDNQNHAIRKLIPQ